MTAPATDTPRTDAVMRDGPIDVGSAWLEMRDHARTLERELAAMTERCAELQAEIDALRVAAQEGAC